MATSRVTRFACYLLPLSFCLFLAAAPPQTESPDDLIRRANDVFRSGDKDAADKLYATAEERAPDPGLVAFNRGAVLFDRKQYRDAEQHYERVLKDAECPPERAARAWYNRGTCLLWRGGSIDVYRAAIACFEHTLDSPAADKPLKDRAADNLELAKLLWNEERKKEENKKKSPNTDVPPEENPQARPDPDKQAGGNDDAGNETDPSRNGNNPKSVGTQPQQLPNGANNPMPTEQTAPGNNATIQPLEDKSEVQQLSEKDARANMSEIVKRIKREQQSLLRTLYGPERPSVRDW